MPSVIAEMLASRRLERVAANKVHALSVIETAQRHVKTALILADTDDQAMADSMRANPPDQDYWAEVAELDVFTAPLTLGR